MMVDLMVSRTDSWLAGMKVTMTDRQTVLKKESKSAFHLDILKVMARVPH